MKIKSKDKIVQKVLKKMDERSLIGQKKYGSTMHDEISTNKKNLSDFLVDVQEEIMDALLYIESARACLQEEVEEVMIAQYELDDMAECANQCNPYWCECRSSSSYPISQYPG